MYASIKGKLWNLFSDEDEQMQVVNLNAGGQEGEFSKKQVVDKQRALHAAQLFFSKGLLGDDVPWDKQD